jgi:UDP-glucose 4-epimerase
MVPSSSPLPFRRALVTGGAGFIGSHLCERLVAAGVSVEALDNLSTGSVANVDHLRANPLFRLIVGDVCDARDLAEPVDRADVVFHMAAAVGVRLIVERPVHTIETNLAGTEAVLEAASKKKKPVLLASTSEVYGKSTALPFREDADLVLGESRRPRWAYACSKLMDEFLALAHHRERALPVVVARLFNTVGPRQTGRYGMVIPRFVAQAMAGKPITVYGDGSQTRTFCHVHDTVRALVGLMAQHGRTAGQVFNIGGEREISIRALAELIVAQLASKSDIRLIPFAQAYDEDFEDMVRRVPDLARIRAAIGYVPEKRLEDIVADVAATMPELYE